MKYVCVHWIIDGWENSSDLCASVLKFPAHLNCFDWPLRLCFVGELVTIIFLLREI